MYPTSRQLGGIRYFGFRHTTKLYMKEITHFPLSDGLWGEGKLTAWRFVGVAGSLSLFAQLDWLRNRYWHLPRLRSE